MRNLDLLILNNVHVPLLLSTVLTRLIHSLSPAMFVENVQFHLKLGNADACARMQIHMRREGAYPSFSLRLK